MSGNQSQGSGGGHSVLHSCIAAAIGACGVPLITALWQRFFGVSLAEWKAYALASVLGGLVFLLLWQGTVWLARLPGVRHRWPFRRWPSPWPAGNRIAIFVADPRFPAIGEYDHGAIDFNAAARELPQNIE